MKSSVNSVWVNKQTNCTDRFTALGDLRCIFCEKYGLI